MTLPDTVPAGALGGSPLADRPPIHLRAAGVSKSFPHAGRRTDVLRSVDLELAPGTTTVVTADPRGGATTLVRCLGASYRVDAGRVVVAVPDAEVDLCWDAGRTVAWIRRHVIAIGDGELIAPPRRSAKAVLERALRADPALNDPDGRSAAVLHSLGLSAVGSEAVGRLGLADRALLATVAALLRATPILLLDEPFRAQGVAISGALADLIEGARATGTAVLVVAADPVPVRLEVDRHLRLSEGRITP